MFLMLMQPLLLIPFIEQISFVWCVNESWQASGGARVFGLAPGYRCSVRHGGPRGRTPHTHTNTHAALECVNLEAT